MEVNLADILIALLILASAGIGIYRGFIREFITIVTWAVAAVFAYIYGKAVGDYIYIVEGAKAKEILGMLTIFVIVIALGYLVKVIVLKAVKLSGVSTIDRVTGGVFGILRGVILVLLVLVASSDEITKQEWFKKSQLLPKFYKVSNTIADTTPKTWRDDLKSEMESMFNCEQEPAPVTTAVPSATATTDDVEAVPVVTPVDTATTPATNGPTTPDQGASSNSSTKATNSKPTPAQPDKNSKP